MNRGSTTPNWFLSRWRGETSLGISYWLNGILLGTLLPALIVLGYSLINPFPHSLRVNALAILILITLRLCLWIWTGVGVIRSANRHTSRGGKLFWANAARVMICLAVVLALVKLESSLIPQMRLLAAIARRHDPHGHGHCGSDSGWSNYHARRHTRGGLRRQGPKDNRCFAQRHDPGTQFRRRARADRGRISASRAAETSEYIRARSLRERLYLYISGGRQA
jgi:hypothetical protein